MISWRAAGDLVPVRRAVRGAPPPEAFEAPLVGALELETVACHWQLSLDAVEHALSAAGRLLTASELGVRRRELALERRRTQAMLADAAHALRIEQVPWLSPVPVTASMLGVPRGTRACLFDVEGVLTDASRLQAWAWGEVFDEILLRFAGVTGWSFVPFDRVVDYRAFVEGRSRVEGIHTFLASRGIHLPEGRFDDPADAETAFGLARRKGAAVSRGLRHRGVTALEGARRYLEATGRAGIGRAVVSASSSTLPILELAGLTELVEERVDADVIHAEGLRSRPAPDMLLVACSRLGVRPDEAVTFAHSPAGVAAGLAAGLTVVGVAAGTDAELLEDFGAERVVPSVAALLDRRLAEIS